MSPLEDTDDLPGVPASGALPDPDVTAQGAARARLLASLLISNLTLYATYAGIIGILLAQQVSLLDPANKIANLAIVSAVSAFFALFAQPLVGALSDRTRSRFGRRSPWILVGAVAGGMLTIVLQVAPNVMLVTIVWTLAQMLLNAYQAPLIAVIADRVPTDGRARAAAFSGVGVSVGATVGIIVAGQLIAQLGVAYWLFGLAVMAAGLLFVLSNRDRSSAALDVPRFRLGAFLRGFWISPRKHPDYAWAFAGRFAITLGYTGVQTYQLYILTDRLHLPVQEAGQIAGLLALCSMVTLTIGTLVFGRLSDVLHRRKIFVFIASVVIAIGVTIPLLIPTVPAMIAFSLIIGIGYGAYISVDAALMIDVLPSHGDVGKDLGVLNIAAALPQAITPLVAALLLGLFGGDYAAIFGFAAIVVLLSAFLVLPIRSVR